jgi:hypothetical protein
MCGTEELDQVEHGYVDTNQFPLIPKAGMSGAPGRKQELAQDSLRGSELKIKPLSGCLRKIE